MKSLTENEQPVSNSLGFESWEVHRFGKGQETLEFFLLASWLSLSGMESEHWYKNPYNDKFSAINNIEFFLTFCFGSLKISH